MLRKLPNPVFAPEGTGSTPAPAASSTASPGVATLSTPAPVAESKPSSTPSGASPSTTPATEAKPAPESSPWDSLDPNFDLDSVEVSTADAVTAAPAAPADGKVEVPPVAPPTPVEAQPPVPQPAPQVPPVQQEQVPPLSLAEPARLAQEMRKNEGVLVDELARQMFALTPEDVEALEENATAFIPKVMARTFLRAHTHMLNQVAQMLPAMIDRHLSVTNASSKNEDAFYAQWGPKGVSKEQHADLVKRIAMTYRQLNPDAPRAQMMEDVGLLVMQAAKIQPPSATAVQQNAAPVTNGSHAPMPFVPAVGGAASAPQQEVQNPWEQWGQDG